MTAVRQIKPLFPNELNRSSVRLELRRSDGVSAFISLNNINKISVLVYDISPFGASLNVGEEHIDKIKQNNNKIFLHLQLHDQKSINYIAEVVWFSKNDYSERIGIKFIEQIYPLPSIAVNQDIKYALRIPEFYKFTLVLYKPYMFFERCIASINAMSENLWEVELNDTELILFRGQIVEFWLIYLKESKVHINAEILQITQVTKNKIRAVILINHISKHVQEWLARQLVLNCNFTPQQVRKVGLDVKELSNGFRFRFVKTQQEYEMVLKLRFKAYVEAGKVDPSKTHYDMAAPLDHLSRILLAYHNDKVVASVSISFPNSNSMVLDTEKAFSNGYPIKVPEKTDIVEIARLCTDSDYRRTDLLTRMFEYTYKVVVCGDRKHILTSTDNKLWPLYKKLGFKKTGMSYPHPYLGGLIHHIIIGERNQPDFGNNMSKLAWNYLWRDMNDFVTERKLIKRSDFRKFKVILFKIAGRIFRIRKQTNY